MPQAPDRVFGLVFAAVLLVVALWPLAGEKPCVAAAERELNVRLPREYRDRLIAVNGGELSTGGDDWRVFPVVDPSRPAPNRLDIVTETHRARSLDGFPAGAAEIATNGDFLLLLPKGNSRNLNPQVQLWRYETREYKPVPPRYDE